jgi:hypothetical protein
MEKIALCFIISYEHILYKEDLWKEWIEANKDIINVYFFYKDLKKIKSKWIYQHAIPQKNICHTSYYQVIPAYIAILNFALKHDKKNTWFCYLTESCCPIITPSKFRKLFQKYKNQTIMPYSKAHWNINFHQRANLALLPKIYHLANDPWFVLTRENAIDIMNFVVNEPKMCNIICNGGLANESLFAIILTHYNKIENVTSKTTHMADWFRMSSPTSPHMFKEGSPDDIVFIDKFLKDNEYVMFIRKIHPSFPNEILRNYIYHKNYPSKQISYQLTTWIKPIINLVLLGIFLYFLILYFTFI